MNVLHDIKVGGRALLSSLLPCRPCLDWSEGRNHIAGHVGAEICRCCFERGWLVRQRGSRAIHLSWPAWAARGLRSGTSSVHRVEPHPIIVHMNLQPIAVMLQLVRPTRTGWRFLGDSRLTRMDESGGRV